MKQLVKNRPTPQTLEQTVQKAYKQLETVKKGIVAETQLKYVLWFKKWNLKNLLNQPPVQNSL